MSEDSRRDDARGPALHSPQPVDSLLSGHSPHDPTVEMGASSSSVVDPSAAAASSRSVGSDELDSPPAGPLLLEGEVLAGRYCVRQFLARGGGGEVYEAEDLELGGRVALKILASGPAGDSGSRSERFRREIQLARRVTHPNVCRLYEFGRHTRRGTPDSPGAREFLFITMELLRGPTLAQHLLDNGPLTPAEGLPIVRQLAAALVAAHQAGVVHRDFKSANVILVSEERTDVTAPAATRAVVTDFGLARAHLNDDLGPTVTATGLIVGSPAYMAPEQVEGGPITPAADLYALGVVLYEMATGAFPFSGESALSIAVKRLREAPVRPSVRHPKIDPRWERVILRCLERRPEDRYPDAAAIAAALDPVSPMPAMSGRRRSLLWAGLGSAAVLSALAYFSLRSPASDSGATPARPVARRSVAVLGLENLSRRPDADWLSTAFMEMLDTELGTGGGLRVISGETVARVRRELGVTQASSLSRETLERLAKNLGSDYILTGSFLEQGSPENARLVLNLRLQDAASGESVSQFAREEPADELFRLTTSAGAQLRAALGVTTDLAVASASALAALPEQPEAARAYAEGLQHLRQRELTEARRLFDRAVELAPDHAAAHSALAEAWYRQGYDTRALASARRAFELSSGLTGRDRLLVEARYRALSRESERAITLYSSLWTLEPDDPENVERLARAQIEANRWKDALATLEAAFAASPALAGDPSLALIEGDARNGASDFNGAIHSARRAVAAAEARGARLLVAEGRHIEGRAQFHLGDTTAAAANYELAAEIFRQLGDREGQALVERSQCSLLRQLGESERAYQVGEHALATFRDMGNQRHALIQLNNLANILYDQNRLNEAAALYEEVRVLAREVENTRYQAAALGNLGNVFLLRGELARAVMAQREALRFKREMGDRFGIATTLVSLALPLIEHTDPAQAVVPLEEAVAISREIGSKNLEGTANHVLGEARYHGGERAAAKALFTTARDQQRALGDRYRATEADLWLGLIALDEGAWQEARNIADGVIVEAQEIEVAALEAAARSLLAQAALGLGERELAAGEARRARAQVDQDEDNSMRWSTLIQVARVEGLLASSARGAAPAKSRGTAGALRRDLERRGFTRTALEAACVEGELELAAGSPAAAEHLRALAERSRRAGYQRVGDAAIALAEGRSKPLGSGV